MSSFINSEQTHVFTSFPDTANDDESGEALLEKPKEPTYTFWQIEFYQKYFDVSTNDVIYRVLGSMIPRINNNYLMTQIKPNPDLYGPFWVCITLIFTIAISGNVVSFFQKFGEEYTWQTDFHKITTSAAAILIYWWLLPSVIYLLAKWRQMPTEFTFLEMLCVYGYSLSIYIPVSVLWVIQVHALQWIFVLIAMALSGTVLVLTFWPLFSSDKANVSMSIMAMIFVLNAALAIGFMIFFFHVPSEANSNDITTKLSPSTLTTTTTTTTTKTAAIVFKTLTEALNVTLAANTTAI